MKYACKELQDLSKVIVIDSGSIYIRNIRDGEKVTYISYDYFKELLYSLINIGGDLIGYKDRSSKIITNGNQSIIITEGLEIEITSGKYMDYASSFGLDVNDQMERIFSTTDIDPNKLKVRWVPNKNIRCVYRDFGFYMTRCKPNSNFQIKNQRDFTDDEMIIFFTNLYSTYIVNTNSQCINEFKSINGSHMLEIYGQRCLLNEFRVTYSHHIDLIPSDGFKLNLLKVKKECGYA